MKIGFLESTSSYLSIVWSSVCNYSSHILTGCIFRGIGEGVLAEVMAEPLYSALKGAFDKCSERAKQSRVLNIAAQKLSDNEHFAELICKINKELQSGARKKISDINEAKDFTKQFFKKLNSGLIGDNVIREFFSNSRTYEKATAEEKAAIQDLMNKVKQYYYEFCLLTLDSKSIKLLACFEALLSHYIEQKTFEEDSSRKAEVLAVAQETVELQLKQLKCPVCACPDIVFNSVNHSYKCSHCGALSFLPQDALEKWAKPLKGQLAEYYSKLSDAISNLVDKIDSGFDGIRKDYIKGREEGRKDLKRSEQKIIAAVNSANKASNRKDRPQRVVKLGASFVIFLAILISTGLITSFFIYATSDMTFSDGSTGVSAVVDRNDFGLENFSVTMKVSEITSDSPEHLIVSQTLIANLGAEQSYHAFTLDFLNNKGTALTPSENSNGVDITFPISGFEHPQNSVVYCINENAIPMEYTLNLASKTVLVNTSGIDVAGSVFLVMQKPFDIIYDGSSADIQHLWYGEKASAPSYELAPTKTGYSFSAWAVENSDGTLSQFNFDDTVKHDTLLKATFTPNEYTVSFTDSTDPLTVTFDGEYSLPSAPSKIGHTFIGYTDDNKMPVDMIGVWSIADDVTLTPSYSANAYTVSGPDGIICSVTYGKAYALPTAPSRAGYTFSEYVDEFGDSFPENGIWSIADDVVLEPAYLANTYNVYVNEDVVYTATYDGAYRLADPSLPDKIGYSAVYVDENGKQFPLNGVWNSLFSISLKPVYIANVYNVYVNGDIIYSAAYGDTYQLPAPSLPDKEGYSAVYVDEDENSFFTSGTWNIPSDITLKPVHIANTYNVYVNGDVVYTATYGDAYRLPDPNLPDKIGYSPVYVDEEGKRFSLSGTWKIDSNITLFLNYAANSYRINVEGIDVNSYSKNDALGCPKYSSTSFGRVYYSYGDDTHAQGFYLDESLKTNLSVDYFSSYCTDMVGQTNFIFGGLFTSAIVNNGHSYADYSSDNLVFSSNGSISSIPNLDEDSMSGTLYALVIPKNYIITFNNNVSSQPALSVTSTNQTRTAIAYYNEFPNDVIMPQSTYYISTAYLSNNGTSFFDSTGKAKRVYDISGNSTMSCQWSKKYTDYTYICSADDFKWYIGNNLQKSSKPSNCGAGKYMLLKDINLGSWNEGWGYTYWTSNNDSTTVNGKTCFTGVFDGQNHTITYKLRIGKTNLQSWAFGLFPVTDGATIKNLNVNADLSTYDPQNRGQKWHISNDDRAEDAMVGGLIGYAKNSTLENCIVSGRVIYNSDGGGGDTCVAGVVGYAYNSSIKNCSSSAEVYARGFYVNVAGVLACYYNTSYSGLSATGKIHFNEDWLAGGHWSGNEVTKSLKVL